MPGLDERADALYALPLDRFTAERDALAKAMKADGDKDAAAEVRRLAKPTQAAWAVNAAIREDPKAAQALVEAARTLAEAQQELLGGGDASALRAAAGRAREAVDALLDAAPAQGAAVDKVRATLHAATVDRDVLEEVAAGRVLRERAASGFGGLEGVTPAKGTTKAKAKPAKPKRDDRRRQEKLRRAKEAEAEAEQELSGARAALEQVESALAQRRKEVRDAEARVKDARRRRERAEG